MNGKQKLLLLQIYIHLLFLVGFFTLPLSFSLPFIIISHIIYVGFCGTAFFHRTVSHKNQINPVLEKVVLLLSWVGASGPAIAWAGTHRKHHRFSDSEKDPHSPKHIGKLRAYWYSSGNEDVLRYVPDLLRKPLYVYQLKYYFSVLIFLHIIVYLIFPFAYYWALVIVPAFLMWFSGSMINVFCHDDKGPININLFGFLFAGEGWHKNHHNDPANPSFKHWADWGSYAHKIMRLSFK